MISQSNLFNPKPSIISMYSTAWCPDCKRAKNFFDRHKIEYENMDIDEIPEATQFVKELNNGARTVPTIVFPNGELLVGPSDAQLAEKFGVELVLKKGGSIIRS